jgi:hypothetical protein
MYLNFPFRIIGSGDNNSYYDDDYDDDDEISLCAGQYKCRESECCC